MIMNDIEKFKSAEKEAIEMVSKIVSKDNIAFEYLVEEETKKILKEKYGIICTERREIFIN